MSETIRNPGANPESKPVLCVRGLKKYYPIKKLFGIKGWVKALDGVSFDLRARETLAIVGESGCGKTTLAKTLMRIETPTEGSLEIQGVPSQQLASSDFYQKIQMIFQDPYSSINPRRRAWEIISEPLRVNRGLSRRDCEVEALKLMQKVGLRPEMAGRYPHMFSGGQRQRIGIARALTLRPQVIICDEPVSALDISIQAQVINLLIDLQDEFGLSYIFISHDLSVVRHLSDKVLVMYLGKVVEYGDRKQIFENPQHPYTKVLLESSPKVRGTRPPESRLDGELPSPLNPPPGCAFHKRCPLATPRCRSEVPELQTKKDRQVACFEVR